MLKIIATSGDGVTGLVEAIKQHSNYLKDSRGRGRRKASRMRSEVLEAAKQYFEDISLKEMTSSEDVWEDHESGGGNVRWTPTRPAAS